VGKEGRITGRERNSGRDMDGDEDENLKGGKRKWAEDTAQGQGGICIHGVRTNM